MTLLALIYQALIPLWERTKHLQNPYVRFGIDALFSIFWLAAFAAVQAWNASGVPSTSTGYCKEFTYGDVDRCTISGGTVILGVLIFLLFLVASAISGYRLWHIRKHGYCPSQKSSISKPQPIEPKFVYPEHTEVRPPTQHDRDLEKGPQSISKDGTHPGRKLSWDAPPNSAPACAPDFLEARPTFRTINYDQSQYQPATERSYLTEPRLSRRPVPARRQTPPTLQLYGPGDRTPALVMDYGATTPYYPPEQYTPQMRQNRSPYPVTPTYHQYRPSMVPAPYTARQANPDPHSSFMGGYRSNYASGIPPSNGYGTLDRRGSTIRMALPGPASTHHGGYHSAYHTPLPTALMSPGQGGYHNFKRESTVQFYSQQQAFSQDRRHESFYSR